METKEQIKNNERTITEHELALEKELAEVKTENKFLRVKEFERKEREKHQDIENKKQAKICLISFTIFMVCVAIAGIVNCLCH